MIKLSKFALFLCVFVSITGFSWGGKTGEAMKLAVHCETDKAVAVITEGEGDGFLGTMAFLEHESILREAGRDKEADAVRAKRESGNPDMTNQEKADAEKSVQDTVAAIRKEREERTGNATCN
jgi:hypothetical protein